jgi:hypothetical protein
MKATSLGVALLLGVASPGGWAANEPDDPRIGALAALITRLNESTEVHRATCEEILTAGVTRGDWSEEAGRYAGYTLADLFNWEAPSYFSLPAGGSALQQRPVALASSSSLLPHLRQQLARARDPVPATAWVFDWLQTRVEGLEDLRQQAGRAMIGPAIDAVERIWLTARSAEEIQAARPLLTRVQSQSFMAASHIWRAATTQRRGGPANVPLAVRGSPSIDLELPQFISYWAILHPQGEPLLLPALDADFATYAPFAVAFRALGEHRSRLLQRPAVAERIFVLRARFREEFESVQKALDDAILREDSATEFAAAALRLSRFTQPVFPQMPMPRFPRRDGPPGSFAGFSGTDIDYRDLVREALESMARDASSGGPFRELTAAQWLPMVGLPPVRGNYGAWLAVREAEASGSTAARQTAVANLRTALPEFRPAVARYLDARLAREMPQAHPAESPGKAWTLPDELAKAADPVTALITALERLADIDRSDDLRSLAASWRTLRAPDASGLRAPARVSQGAWPRALVRPGGAALNQLRERAARALLSADPEAGADLAAQILERLEAAVQRSDFSEARRILAVDAACAALPASEHEAYQLELNLLNEAEAAPAESAPRYRQLIRGAGARATGALAAQRLRQARR